MSRRRPGARAFVVSVAVHGILLVPLVVLARPPEPIEFETIRLHLVSMPEPQPTPAPPDLEPQPVPVEEEPEPEPEPEPPPEEPEPEPEPTQPDIEKPPETPDQPSSETEPAPDATGAEVDVTMEGREFPYPEYLANVIVQVKRYFRWNDESDPVAVVYFEITPDGAVRNIRMVESSGNIRFDFAVQGAVETAGSRGAFGALPEGFAGPFLPIQLEVEPPR